MALEATLTWGELLEISVTAVDGAGLPVTLEGEYTGAMAVCREKTGGSRIAGTDLAMSGATATATIDTSAAEFTAGIYYYDIRLTDSTGRKFWSESVKLTLNSRNTQPL